MLALNHTPAPAFRQIKPGYRVGLDGSVWSCIVGGRYPRVGDEWRLMKPRPNCVSGHMTLCLGREDTRYVHILVLEAFVGPCPVGLECRHLDGNPANNNLWNLKWGTRAENHADSVRHGTAFIMPDGLLGEENPSSKLNEDTAREIWAMRLENGWGSKRIAIWLGLGERMRGAVDGIIRGQSWNQVTGLPPYRPQSHTPGRRKGTEAPSDNEEVAMLSQVVLCQGPLPL